jgi:hypothetical protein
MTRPNGVVRGTLPPDQWPDWVLSFPEPWISRDPVKQAARMARFHLWRRERDARMAKSGVTWLAVFNEYRRRVAVWQESHPEDRSRQGGASWLIWCVATTVRGQTSQDAVLFDKLSTLGGMLIPWLEQ